MALCFPGLDRILMPVDISSRSWVIRRLSLGSYCSLRVVEEAKSVVELIRRVREIDEELVEKLEDALDCDDLLRILGGFIKIVEKNSNSGSGSQNNKDFQPIRLNDLVAIDRACRECGLPLVVFGLKIASYTLN